MGGVLSIFFSGIGFCIELFCSVLLLSFIIIEDRKIAIKSSEFIFCLSYVVNDINTSKYTLIPHKNIFAKQKDESIVAFYAIKQRKQDSFFFIERFLLHINYSTNAICEKY